MPITAGSVLLRAANHLNDPNQLWYTSQLLMPFLNMALERFEEELGAHEISAYKKSSITILVDENEEELAQMPVDYVEAYALYERARGSGSEWSEIKEFSDISPALKVNKGTSVTQWACRNTKIFINPPSQQREVLIEYISTTTPASNDTTNIDIFASRRFLALETARCAARDMGNAPTKALTFEKDIEESLDNVIRRLQKADQGNLGVRRLPYRGRG